MVERFQMKTEHDWICARPDDKGDWVRFSDYADLQRQLAEARAEVERHKFNADELRKSANRQNQRYCLVIADHKAERDRLAAGIQALGECLAGLDHSQVTPFARDCIRAALDTAKGAEG